MKLLAIVALGLILFPAATRADGDQTPPPSMPTPDRAEIVATTSPIITSGPKVEVGHAQARKIGRLIDAQEWLGTAGSCDKPQYLLRFYAHDKLIATDTICFACGCFARLQPNLDPADDPQSFNTATTRAKELQASLAALFPSAK